MLVQDELVSVQAKLVDEILESHPSAAAQLRALVRAMVMNASRYQSQLAVFYRERGFLAGERVAEIDRRWDGVRKRMEQIVQRGIESGELDPRVDPRIAIAGIVGMAVWVNQWFRPDGELSIETIAGELAHQALSGLVPGARRSVVPGSGSAPARMERGSAWRTLEGGGGPAASEGGTMQVDELISSARDVVSVKRVYGDPYEKNGLTVIPAATVRGGGGGGSGESEGGEPQAGGGFGMVARPSGAWIIENGDATWKPAIDVNRIVLGGQVIAMTAIIVTGRILLARSRRRRSVLAVVPVLAGLRRMRLNRHDHKHLRRPKLALH